ncbi:hypothetical protein V3N99_21005 [Dermatophilaceae bacterium Soc4.6]
MDFTTQEAMLVSAAIGAGFSQVTNLVTGRFNKRGRRWDGGLGVALKEIEQHCQNTERSLYQPFLAFDGSPPQVSMPSNQACQEIRLNIKGRVANNLYAYQDAIINYNNTSFVQGIAGSGGRWNKMQTEAIVRLRSQAEQLGKAIRDLYPKY